MINKQFKQMLSNKSVIRELSEYATKRSQEIGRENVFDYSLGNPSIPTTSSYTESTIKLLNELAPEKLHGYSPTLGIPEVKEKVATSLNKRFDFDYSSNHIFMTSGAAGALAHALRAVSKLGDKVITFAPFFPEYIPYTKYAGLELVVVPASLPDMQIDFDKLEELFDESVSIVLINTPNNPSGVIYTEETLLKLSDLLRRKEEEYNHEIFLISDEPYREIVFDNGAWPYPSKYYDNAISCYSFSKSLSLPGERIGYVAINPKAKDSELLVPICGQISRGIGHNCPSALIMRGVSEVIDDLCDFSIYETNMNLLYNKLVELGFEVNKPDGTFYIFPKALEEDANEFCKKALKYDLVLVPSDSFGVQGYFRMAYCVDTEKVRRSLVNLERFVLNEYNK